MADLVAISLGVLGLEVTETRKRLFPVLTATYSKDLALLRPTPALHKLRDSVELLRSTKLFVKDYHGEVDPHLCGVRSL
jgi:hypothetical protein